MTNPRFCIRILTLWRSTVVCTYCTLASRSLWMIIFFIYSTFTVFLCIKWLVSTYCTLVSRSLWNGIFFIRTSAFTVFLCIKTTRLVCNLLHFSLKITMKWNFLHFSNYHSILMHQVPPVWNDAMSLLHPWTMNSHWPFQTFTVLERKW